MGMGIVRAVAVCIALLLAACGEPVPKARLAYVGEWHAEKMQLVITQDGFVNYVRRSEHGKTTVNAPIQRFDGDHFVVGIGPFSTTFVVSKPPHLDGAAWKMTVDGVELVRRSGPSDFNA